MMPTARSSCLLSHPDFQHLQNPAARRSPAQLPPGEPEQLPAPLSPPWATHRGWEEGGQPGPPSTASYGKCRDTMASLSGEARAAKDLPCKPLLSQQSRWCRAVPCHRSR